MEIARIYKDKNGQAVKLPDKFRLTGDEVVIQQLGFSLILTPKDKITRSLLSAGMSRKTNPYKKEHPSDDIKTKTRKGTDYI